MKARYIIGIDPDCKKSGIAIFDKGKIIGLSNLNIVEYFEYCNKVKDQDCVFVVEDGNLISSLYKRNKKGNAAVQHKISENVGANKQRATDLINIARSFGIKVVAQKPRAGNWANKKDMFERVTGWNNRSNPETRSAAFFGYFYAAKK